MNEDTADLVSVVGRFDVGRLHEHRLLEGGLINHNHWIRTSRGEWLLRGYPSDRTESEVRFELSVLDRLGRAGVPGPVPVPSRTGEPFTRSADGALCSLLSFVPGRGGTRSDLTAELAYESGAMYARVRRALEGFTPDGSHERADGEQVAPLVADLVARLPGHVARLLDRAWRSVAPRFAATPDDRFAVVHGDLYYANMILDDAGRLVAFIDYDDAYVGDTVLDLATLVMEMATPHTAIVPELASAVLSGYGDRPPTGLLLDAIIFQHCKFLCYTVELSGTLDGIEDNDYYQRLVLLMADGHLERLEKELVGQTSSSAGR
ncbi:phosphotransferase [Nonomuraea helvata]|uniref:Phosphotransferase n=1 Tax=Nonomuraea helvata TaxID=37484 RepID=A0ABV5SAG4_9ACTN